MRRIPKQLNEKAFTLIELLTVVAIISMLVGLMAIGMRRPRSPPKTCGRKRN
jgi:prepilin-type N-terminal cleavage/methylation domain-containing protein